MAHLTLEEAQRIMGVVDATADESKRSYDSAVKTIVDMWHSSECTLNDIGDYCMLFDGKQQFTYVSAYINFKHGRLNDYSI